MKQELRCHAVLCPKEEKAKQMATALQDRLHQALIDFKKEKISRQNARLSLANCLHDNPGIPYRKLLLQAATSNYKPPIERSKSAPKLTSIEEAELEEEEEYEYEIPLEEDEGTTLLVSIRYHSRFFDCLEHPSLIATLASDGQWHSAKLWQEIRR